MTAEELRSRIFAELKAAGFRPAAASQITDDIIRSMIFEFLPGLDAEPASIPSRTVARYTNGATRCRGVSVLGVSWDDTDLST